jgi:hypothetical protein
LQDGETQAFGSANGGMRIYSEEEKLKFRLAVTVACY